MKLRSIDWPGSPIVHACTAQASWGQLLLLTEDGALHGLDLDSGRSWQLAKLELPEPTAPTAYWPHGFKVHCALSGDHAVIADDGGTFGVLVNLRTGEPAAQLLAVTITPEQYRFPSPSPGIRRAMCCFIARTGTGLTRWIAPRART